MPRVVEWLRKQEVRSIVDFGCGNGRNAVLLAAAFSPVVLVEVEGNTTRASEFVAEAGLGGVSVMTDAQCALARIKVDAVLLSCVIHTLPDDRMRRRVVARARTNLRKTGRRFVVFVTPVGDSAYRAGRLGDAVTYNDGIVRLHTSSRTFSFYKRYTRNAFEDFISSAGLRIETHIGGDHRHLYVTSPMRAR